MEEGITVAVIPPGSERESRILFMRGFAPRDEVPSPRLRADSGQASCFGTRTQNHFRLCAALQKMTKTSVRKAEGALARPAYA